MSEHTIMSANEWHIKAKRLDDVITHCSGEINKYSTWSSIRRELMDVLKIAKGGSDEAN